MRSDGGPSIFMGHGLIRILINIVITSEYLDAPRYESGDLPLCTFFISISKVVFTKVDANHFRMDA